MQKNNLKTCLEKLANEIVEECTKLLKAFNPAKTKTSEVTILLCGQSGCEIGDIIDILCHYHSPQAEKTLENLIKEKLSATGIKNFKIDFASVAPRIHIRYVDYPYNPEELEKVIPEIIKQAKRVSNIKTEHIYDIIVSYIAETSLDIAEKLLDKIPNFERYELYEETGGVEVKPDRNFVTIWFSISPQWKYG